MNITKWKTQLRKGFLEFYLLNLLQDKELYGVSILDALEQMGLTITDGTLYPLLSRLTREGLIQGKWITHDTKGHPRKYFKLTAAGKKLLQVMKKEWSILTQAINLPPSKKDMEA
jgi:PadR family transcriptional regulator, regulatory protein PadR